MILVSILFVLFSLISFFFGKKISLSLNLYDLPDKKLKTHKKKILIYGGISLIFYNIFLFIYFLINFKNITSFIAIYIVCIFLIFLIGFLDDLLKIKPTTRLYCVLFICFIFLIANGQNQNNYSIYSKFIFTELNLDFYYFDFLQFFPIYLMILVTTVFLLLFIFSSNMLDGINGFSGIYFLINLIYLLIKNNEDSFFYNNIFLLLIFLIHYLYLNLKNVCFYGDAGVYTLSFITGLSLIYSYNQNFINFENLIIIVFLPFIDCFRVSFLRICKKKNPFYGDKNHIHHLLFKQFGLNRALIYLICIVLIPLVLSELLYMDIFIILAQLITYFYIIKKINERD